MTILRSASAVRESAARIGRSPQTLVHLCIDRIFVPWWVRWLGITIGTGCSFIGQPVVTVASGARIALGNEVRVFSRTNSNPAGLPHPTILAALASGSSIIIGDGTGISGASIAARAQITIGRNVLIGAGACLWDTDFHPLEPGKRREHATRDAKCSPISIDDDVFIGARAIILKGVRVGWGAVVGAGAVVTKDVQACDIVAGNPAAIVGSVDRRSERKGTTDEDAGNWIKRAHWL